MSRQSIQAGKAVIVVDIVDKATASFNKLTGRLSKTSKALRDMSTNTAGGALLSGLVTSKVLSTYTKFEDQILNLSAKLGYFGIVSKQQQATLDDLKETIIQLGKATSYTSVEVAEAAVALAQAGFAPTEIKASLQGVLDLARGTGYSLGETADMMANIIRTFNMFGANDSLETRMQKVTNVTSQVVKATRLGTVEIQDLRESLKYAAGSAQNLGADLPVVLGLLVQMSESGLKASLAGTSMNTAFLNLVQNMDALKTKLPAFNVFLDSMGRVDFSKTFQSLMDATKGISNLEKVKIFQDVFNIRGARMISSIQEMERVQHFIKEIALAGEEARLAAAKMESGVGGATRRMTSAFEALQIRGGETFKDLASAIFNFITVGLDAMAALVMRNKQLVATLLLLPVGFAGVAASSLLASFAFARLTMVIRGLVSAGKSIGGIGKIMGGGLASLTNPVKAVAQGKLNRMAAYKAQQARVAKMQSKYDISLAKAQAKKTAAAQAKAITRVQSSVLARKLADSKSKLSTMGKGNIAGLMGSGMNLARSAGSAAMKGIKGIGRGASALLQVRKEKAEIRGQIKLEELLRKKNTAQTIQRLRNYKNVQTDTTARNAKIAASQKKLSFLNNKLNTIDSARRRSAAQQLSKINKFQAVQNRSFDRLYKVRKAIQALEANPIEQITTAKEGKRVPLTQEALKKMEQQRLSKLVSLRQREARLVGIVNTDLSAREKFFKAEVAAETKKIDTKKASIRTAIKQEAGVIARQQKQIGLAGKLDTITNKANRKAIGRQGVSFNIDSMKRTGAAQKALGNTSYLKTIGSGLKTAGAGLRSLFSGANMMKSFAVMGKGVSTLYQLSTGFLKLTGSLTRFVFSWNFVGLALNALLLFGDKISFIKQAFVDLGQGFTAAFQQIGKIAHYAAPAMDLLSLAFTAFVEGDTNTGVTAITTALSGVVSIIQNQLMAAWNAFIERTTVLWTTLQQIGMVIWTIIKGIIDSLGTLFQSFTGPLSDALSSMSGGGGGLGATLMSIVSTLGFTLNNFLSYFTKAVVSLQEWGMSWISALQVALGKSIDAIDIGGALFRGGGKALQNQGEAQLAIDSLRASKLRADSEIDRKKRENDLIKVLQTNTQSLQGRRQSEVDRFNSQSDDQSRMMGHALMKLTSDFQNNMAARQAALAADMIKQGQLNNMSSAAQPEVVQFFRGLTSLVGSISSTRGAALVDSKSTLKEQQTTNELLKEINQNIKTGGAF